MKWTKRRQTRTKGDGMISYVGVIGMILLLRSSISVSSFTLHPVRISRFRSPPMKSSTVLHGIRGFRAWFESQFPNAMTAFDHPSMAPPKQGSNQSKSKSKTKTKKYPPPTPDNEIISESFHHVLIDVNQLLHITLRRSKSDDHALILLLKELDKCLSIARPKRSIVLAFDGPPAAAKLATQRRRRFGILVKNMRRKDRMNMLIEKGLIMPPEKVNKSSGKYKKKMRKEEREELTLSITPGTHFMDRAEEAVLYWAWQRLSNPKGRMQIQNCRIYVSSSSVPGEGEVKLLDWLFQAGQFSHHASTAKSNVPIIRKGDSVAIMGGDSDLVLEGLVIPPSITHNVFVILPSGNTKSYAVSLWETTLTLDRFLGSRFDTNDTMRIRTDLVLLLIMNGNDYLPKLRGSSGFNKLFHTYLYLLKKWLLMEKSFDGGGGNVPPRPFFVEPNSLKLNLPFCIAFFEALASTAPKCLVQRSDMTPFRQSITPLSHLYSLVDSGLFPGPAEFQRISVVGGKDEEENGKEVMRLTLGRNNTNSSLKSEEETMNTKILKKYYEFDVLHRVGRPLKKSKQLLANIALEELLGEDYMEISDYVVGNDVESDGSIGDNEDDEENDMDLGNLSSGIGYSWEMETSAACSVEEYLKGLIWNLATYQDGVCSDYSYNYGRRMSPTAEEMLNYLKDAEDSNRCIGREELLSDNFTEPLSDGLSCLAALPTEVRHLIPKPYNKLAEDGVVEDIYASCMDKDTNVFDINAFKQKCMERIDLNDESNDGSSSQPELKHKRRKGRKIRTGKTFWTVLRRVKKPLTHPYEPPKGFSDRLTQLRSDNKIKVFHMHATDRPRWLRNETKRWRERRQENLNEAAKFTDMGGIISDSESLENVEFMRAYQSYRKKETKLEKRKSRWHSKGNTETTSINDVENEEYINEMARMEKHEITPPPTTPKKNVDGFNGMQCIKELCDIGVLTQVKWSRKAPSHSTYASIDPELYEEVKVEIKGHGFTLVFCQDRNRNLFSRKVMKHHLASMALSQIFSNINWITMSTDEMKSHLVSSNSTQINQVNVENRNALQCLHELKDSGMFEVSWDFSSDSPSTEHVLLNVKSGVEEVNFNSKEMRNIYKTSKATTKQNLAGAALCQLLGSEANWKNMTLSEMKGRIIVPKS